MKSLASRFVRFSWIMPQLKKWELSKAHQARSVCCCTMSQPILNPVNGHAWMTASGSDSNFEFFCAAAAAVVRDETGLSRSLASSKPTTTTVAWSYVFTSQYNREEFVSLDIIYNKLAAIHTMKEVFLWTQRGDCCNPKTSRSIDIEQQSPLLVQPNTTPSTQ